MWDDAGLGGVGTGRAGLGWAGLGWAGLDWAGLGGAGLGNSSAHPGLNHINMSPGSKKAPGLREPKNITFDMHVCKELISFGMSRFRLRINSKPPLQLPAQLRDINTQGFHPGCAL